MKYIKICVWIFFVGSVLLFAAAMVRSFLNRDGSRPVITSEQEEISVPCGYTQEEIREGLRATDEEDGDLTDQILVGHMSRFIEPGLCDVTYVVFDSGDQSASLTRRVRFSDYTPPEFRASEALVYPVKEGDYQQTMERLSVYDKLEGEIEDGVQQTESTVLYSSEGSYTISLEASNRFGDTATLNLPVHIVASDRMNVKIQLTEYIVYLDAGEGFDPSSLISEEQTGGLSAAQVAVVSSNVNTGQAGVYEVEYTASTESGTGVTWATVVVR